MSTSIGGPCIEFHLWYRKLDDCDCDSKPSYVGAFESKDGAIARVHDIEDSNGHLFTFTEPPSDAFINAVLLSSTQVTYYHPSGLIGVYYRGFGHREFSIAISPIDQLGMLYWAFVGTMTENDMYSRFI